MNKLLELAVDTAKKAGDVVLSIYNKENLVKIKQDGSPLTSADTASHKVIVDQLSASHIHVVSEEGDNLLMQEKSYWLVDPLDGTKDFLAHNNEFTINIALISNQFPVFGVVYAPALNELYAGGLGIGTWKQTKNKRLPCCIADKYSSPRMAISRFHTDIEAVNEFALDNLIVDKIEIGSALKYGYLAIGKVDVFPRFTGSSEWDTAAGQAVLEGVGGHLLNWNTGARLHYGKFNRRNPRLLAFRSPYEKVNFKLKTYEGELL